MSWGWRRSGHRCRCHWRWRVPRLHLRTWGGLHQILVRLPREERPEGDSCGSQRGPCLWGGGIAGARLPCRAKGLIMLHGKGYRGVGNEWGLGACFSRRTSWRCRPLGPCGARRSWPRWLVRSGTLACLPTYEVICRPWCGTGHDTNLKELLRTWLELSELDLNAQHLGPGWVLGTSTYLVGTLRT